VRGPRHGRFPASRGGVGDTEVVGSASVLPSPLPSSSTTGWSRFLFQIVNERVIQVKLLLEGTIGHTTSTSEEVYHLVEYLIEIHYRFFTSASAASVSGNQNVIAIFR
jgi:hypothetical protein